MSPANPTATIVSVGAASPATHAARLVADIGGTNGRFAIVRDGRMTERREYRNAEFPDLATLIARYLADAGSADDAVAAACLAVAAPISADGVAQFTNAPWKVAARELEEAMRLPRVALINDFAAQAYGLESLGTDGVATIANGTGDDPVPGARVVLGPGTGLGCAALVPATEKDEKPFAVTSEGGHMGFAATTADDRRIFDAAFAKFGRVSWERVCCGSGLALVHAAMWPDDRVDGVVEGNPGEVVTLAKADPEGHAARSVRQFSGMLGAFAGDLALVFRASNGVYLTGGVLGHLGAAFDTRAFLERFVDKGRYRAWLAGLPVHRIVADDCALRGCARYLERTEA